MLKIRRILWFALLAFVGPALALDVSLDAASARALLAAIQNPALTREEAVAVAALPGNEGLIRKAVSYHIDATRETFADAVLASAHGAPIDTPTARYLGLERLRAKAGALSALLNRLAAEPARFEGWVVQRVAAFSPVDGRGRISGYLVVGGTSGGFSFDEPRFYLNLDYFDEFDPARVLLAHELYHAVQNLYSVDNDDHWLKPARPTAAGRAEQQACANLASLFGALYQEGSASYVGDALLLDPDTGPLARKTRTELSEGLRSLRSDVTLLELAVVGLQAERPVPYDDVYALGFYVPEPLYKLGYAMAKAIALEDSSAALTALLRQPGTAFLQAYVRLPNYGKDRDHPALGPHTLEALALLAADCKR